MADASTAQRRPGPGAWLFFTPLLLWLLIFVIAPTFLLIVMSFAERDSLGRIVYNFTFENYLRAFDWVWMKIFLTSIWYAFLTTVICVILGYPVAYFIGRSPERWRNLLIILVMIPFLDKFSYSHIRLDHDPEPGWNFERMADGGIDHSNAGDIFVYSVCRGSGSGLHVSAIHDSADLYERGKDGRGAGGGRP
jgi:hypothetical protein